ncbi:MAG: efflux RND transporter permease subunit, partial [Deltaproteobacteria bacterium]|nr:efflux RND transporter permease subunit [Deltaproteobacteria bacterium]
MNLSAVFIRRPVMATLMAVAIAAFGIKAYQSLPVSDLPNVYYPVIVISCEYPGASALTMASAVAAPLEQHCQGLEGLTTIHSKSRPGYCNVELTFDLSRNLDAAAQDVQGAINRAASDLPDDLSSAPTYAKINPADSPILYLAVSSETLPLAQLYTFGADRVAKALSQINGVAQVEIWGSRPAVRIQVDPDKLAARNLAITDVAMAVINSNVTIPAGSTEGRFRSYFIQPQSQFSNAAEFNRLIVTYRGQSPIYLEDIGEAVDSVEATTMTVRLRQQGQKAKTGVIALGV